jgi:hypothetical protein
VKKLARVVTVAALVGGFVAGVAPAATAAPAKAKLLDSVTLRAKATSNSTARGVIPKGSTVSYDDVSYVVGGKYTACGVTEKIWYPVTYKGVKGYIVAACMK